MTQRQVTITDVAKLAGVSISTVSRVLNNSTSVAEELHNRVMEAVAELQYTPSLLAQNLRRNTITSPMIGVVVPSLRPPFFSEAAESLQDVLTEHDRIVHVCNANSDPELEMVFVRHLHSLHVDGVVFISTWGWDDIEPIKYLVSHEIPVVIINRKVENLSVDLIQIDKTLGNYLAASYLIDLGHREIGCISLLSLGSVQPEEMNGYRRALQEAGIAISEDLMVAAYPSLAGGYEAAKRLLSRRNRPTAIFARSDMLALGAIRAVFDLGLRVPEDVSVVGFGDTEFAQYANPSLTTIRQPIADLGSMAATMLLERIANKQLGLRQSIIEPRLVTRNSAAKVTQLEI